MRITTQMVNETARKSGLPINNRKDRTGVLKIANEMLEKHFRDDSFLNEIEETKMFEICKEYNYLY